MDHLKCDILLSFHAFISMSEILQRDYETAQVLISQLPEKFRGIAEDVGNQQFTLLQTFESGNGSVDDIQQCFDNATAILKSALNDAETQQ